MTMAESQFVPGARVAVSGGRWSTHLYKEAFVDKVHKNGNFTLKGDESRQQYRPSYDGLEAWQTGKDNTWHRTKVRLWTDEIDVEIKEKAALDCRGKRLNAILEATER